MAKVELSKEKERQDILDFIVEKIGPYFYNQAIFDVQQYMSEKTED